jgi:hypothetical protein
LFFIGFGGGLLYAWVFLARDFSGARRQV